MRRRYERVVGSGTSWTSVVIGWLAALGASLILSGLVTAVVSLILTALGFGGGAEAGTTGLVGVLLALFLAFLIGGYAAGRMAGRDGSKHGLLVALLALVDSGPPGRRRGAWPYKQPARRDAPWRPDGDCPEWPGYRPDPRRCHRPAPPVRRRSPRGLLGGQNRPRAPVERTAYSDHRAL